MSAIINRFVRKMAGADVVITDNANRTVYSASEKAMGAPYYFHYNKVVSHPIDESTVEQWMANLPEGLMAVETTGVDDEFNVGGYLVELRATENRVVILVPLPTTSGEGLASIITVSLLKTMSLAKELPVSVIRYDKEVTLVPMSDSGSEETAEEMKELGDLLIDTHDEIFSPSAPTSYEFQESQSGKFHCKELDVVFTDFITDDILYPVASAAIHLLDRELPENPGTDTLLNSCSEQSVDGGKFAVINPWDENVTVIVSRKDDEKELAELLSSIIHAMDKTEGTYTSFTFCVLHTDDFDVIAKYKVEAGEDFVVNQVRGVKWDILELIDNEGKMTVGDKEYGNVYVERVLVLNPNKTPYQIKPTSRHFDDYKFSSLWIEEREIFYIEHPDHGPLVINPADGSDTAFAAKIVQRVGSFASVEAGQHMHIIDVDEPKGLYEQLKKLLTEEDTKPMNGDNYITSTDWRTTVGETDVHLSILAGHPAFDAISIQQVKDISDLPANLSCHYVQQVQKGNELGIFFTEAEHIHTGDTHQLAISVVAGKASENVPAVIVVNPLARFDARLGEDFNKLSREDILMYLISNRFISEYLYTNDDGGYVAPAIVYCDYLDTRWYNTVARAITDADESTLPYKWSKILDLFNARKNGIFNKEVEADETKTEEIPAAAEVQSAEPLVEEPVVEEPQNTGHDVVDEIHTKPEEEEEVTEVVEETSSVVEGTHIEVEVSSYLRNHTDYSVTSNINVVDAEYAAAVNEQCMGIVVDFNDYVEATKLVEEAREKGLPVYQYRNLPNGHSDIHRIL